MDFISVLGDKKTQVMLKKKPMRIFGGQAHFFSSSLWVENISGKKKKKKKKENGQHFGYGSLMYRYFPIRINNKNLLHCSGQYFSCSGLGWLGYRRNTAVSTAETQHKKYILYYNHNRVGYTRKTTKATVGP